MFIGEYAHNIDTKGRLIIPARFREELDGTIIVTRGLDGCLYIYTASQWNILYEQMMKLPSTKKEARMYIRMLTSKAAECEIDNQGRILLPATLTQLADLKKACVISGAGNRVEIWSKERWDTINEENNESFEEMAESLTEFF
ncbi:MAG: division/cell wall cluster transcriptional repressor MraZ [Erysipelotrichaceae bacterium]